MKVFTDFSNTELRDSQTGRLVPELPPQQRERYLLQHPEHKDRMPPPRPELKNPAFSTERDPPKLGVSARPVMPRQGALLRDPAQSSFRKEPTQLRKVEYNKFRIAIHEASHACLCEALGVKLYKLTINARENVLGELLHKPSTPENEIIILLAGREGEIAIFGDAGEGDGSDVRHATRLARELNPNNPDEAMRIYRTVARNMVLERKRLISALAFELHRKRELLLDQIYTAIAEARQKIAADDKPARQVRSAASTSTSTSTPRKGRKLSHAEMVARFGPNLVGTTAIVTGKQR